MQPKRENIETFIAKRRWEESGHIVPPIAVLVHSLHEHFRGDLMTLLEPYGVQFSEWGALTTLYSVGEPYQLSPTQINEAMLFSSGGISKVLTRLYNLELIKRVDNSKDQRSKLASLTVKGLTCVLSVHKQLKQLETAQLKGLSKSELTQLEGLLTKLNRNWES